MAQLVIQRVLRGFQARNTPFNLQMGTEGSTEEHPVYPGRIGYVYAEDSARGFYAHWQRMLTERDWATLAPSDQAIAAE